MKFFFSLYCSIQSNRILGVQCLLENKKNMNPLYFLMETNKIIIGFLLHFPSFFFRETLFFILSQIKKNEALLIGKYRQNYKIANLYILLFYQNTIIYIHLNDFNELTSLNKIILILNR